MRVVRDFFDFAFTRHRSKQPRPFQKLGAIYVESVVDDGIQCKRTARGLGLLAENSRHLERCFRCKIDFAVTWSVWATSSSVTLLYGWLVLHDGPMIAAATVSTGGSLGVLGAS